VFYLILIDLQIARLTRYSACASDPLSVVTIKRVAQHGVRPVRSRRGRRNGWQHFEQKNFDTLEKEHKIYICMDVLHIFRFPVVYHSY